MSSPPDLLHLETERLLIRPFVMDDLETIHRLLNAAFSEEQALEERREWLQWSVLNYAALARLHQPPYGDYGIVLKGMNTLIGSVGLVPAFGPFDKLPHFRKHTNEPLNGLFTPQIGLFWALGDEYRGQGYATEAARALIEFAFTKWSLKRIVATTEYENENSMAVMKRLGMTIERNPDPDPFWFQVVGILENSLA